jgi:signal transduction histidine kinase
LTGGVLLLALAGMTGFFFMERWRMQSVLEERQRLAHEMHDTLAQSFAGLGFQLQAVQDDLSDGIDIMPQLQQAQEMVRNSHEEARRSISALRPELLESVGLLSTLENCARRLVSRSASVEIKTVSEGSVQSLPLGVSDTLLRIGYEAIANSIRHAHCSRLTISLLYDKSIVELIVADNGAGFVVSSDSAGFGIRGMHKRADNIAAHFGIDSSPGNGTRVYVRAPIPPSFTRAIARRWLVRLPLREGQNEHTRI